VNFAAQGHGFRATAAMFPAGKAQATARFVGASHQSRRLDRLLAAWLRLILVAVNELTCLIALIPLP
jgi:hypothetical protein